MAANVTLLMLLNADPQDPVDCQLPAMHDEHWRVLIDTARRGGRAVAGGSAWTATPRSLALLAVERDRMASSAKVAPDGGEPPPSWRASSPDLDARRRS